MSLIPAQPQIYNFSHLSQKYSSFFKRISFSMLICNIYEILIYEG